MRQAPSFGEEVQLRQKERGKHQKSEQTYAPGSHNTRIYDAGYWNGVAGVN